MLKALFDNVTPPVRGHPRHTLASEHLRAGDLVTGGAGVPETGDPGQGDQEEPGQKPHHALVTRGHLTRREWDWD